MAPSTRYRPHCRANRRSRDAPQEAPHERGHARGQARRRRRGPQGAAGEEEDHLQARRRVRQGVRRAGEGGGPPQARGPQDGRLLRPRPAEGVLCRPSEGYLQDRPQAEEDPAAAAPAPDQQRRLCPRDQGDAADAAPRRAVHHLRRAQPQGDPRARLQARLRQGRRPAHPHLGQPGHRAAPRQARPRLRRGPRPRDRHVRPQLQAGHVGPLAVQALQPDRRLEAQEVYRLRRGRRHGQPGEAHLQAHPPDGLSSCGRACPPCTRFMTSDLCLVPPHAGHSIPLHTPPLHTLSTPPHTPDSLGQATRDGGGPCRRARRPPSSLILFSLAACKPSRDWRGESEFGTRLGTLRIDVAP